jgi:serine/threonine protein phosphatase PrpC
VGVLTYSETLQGCSPGQDKPNQDYAASKDIHTNHGVAHIRLVADGHGTNGHSVSQFIGDKVIEMLEKFIQDFDDSTQYTEYGKEMLISTFEGVERELAESGIDIRFSGSTLTVAVIWQGYAAIANTGDSKAVLLSKVKNLINVSAETALHHPEEEQEKKRILEAGGIVTPLKTKDGEFEGPMRVWQPDYSGPGLAVARSFGDLRGKETGVISQPGTPALQDILLKKLGPEDKALILASDGLWDYMQHKTLISKLVPYILSNNVKQACKCLIRHSADKWEEVAPCYAGRRQGRHHGPAHVLPLMIVADLVTRPPLSNVILHRFVYLRLCCDPSP